MEKNIKKLIFVFVLINLVKILLNFFIKSPSAFADAYFYTLSAKSLINLNFIYTYPPLYSLIISWAYLFANSGVSYFLIKVTNSLLSSLVIFPAYFLAKEYLKKEKISFYCVVIISLLPSNFAYSSFIMAENLFNFLFLMAVYSLYMGFKKGKKWFFVLSSLFIALCYSTKVIAIALFPIVILFALTEKKYKEGLFVLILCGIFLIPYFMIESSLFLGYENPITRVTTEGRVTILDIFFWGIMTLSLIYLQGFIIFTNSAVKSLKNNSMNRLFVISILSVVGLALYPVIASINNYLPADAIFSIGGRPMGRYIFSVLPLIIIMGINNLRKFKINYFWALPFSVLMLYPLLPPNNINVTWLGIFSFFIEYQGFWIQLVINLLIILFIIFLFNYFRRYINLKRIILTLFLLNLVIFAGIGYNADKYYFNKDTAKAGRYLNEIASNSLIVIDKQGCEGKWVKELDMLCDKNNEMSLVGFWLQNVVIGDYTDGDYFVSKRELNLKKIKQFGEVIIYET